MGPDLPQFNKPEIAIFDNRASEDPDGMTVGGAFQGFLRDFIKSDASNPPDFSKISKRASETLGIPVCDGVIISHATATPSLHLHKIPLAETLRSIDQNSSNFGDLLKQYQKIEAETPSHEALRVLSIIIRKFLGANKEQQTNFKKLIDQALEIDLTKPADPSWESKLELNLNGVNSLFTIKLKPISEGVKIASRFVSSDLSNEAKKNNYGFAIEFRDLDSKDSEQLINLKNKWRQIENAICIWAPPALAAIGGKILIAWSQIQNPFSNTWLKSGFNLGLEILPVALAFAGTFLIQQKLSRDKARSPIN